MGGLLLAFVLVASQASAWFHAAAISHVACLEHGEAMHGGAAPGPGDAKRAAPDDEGSQLGFRADLTTVAGHDHCANAALLRWRDVDPRTARTRVPADAVRGVARRRARRRRLPARTQDLSSARQRVTAPSWRDVPLRPGRARRPRPVI